MPSPSEEVILVKLPRPLAARLRGHAAGWDRAYSKGQHAPAPNERGEYSLAAIIEVLLRRDERHRAAGRRPRRVRYQG